jgi:hypothetical protein
MKRLQGVWCVDLTVRLKAIRIICEALYGLELLNEWSKSGQMLSVLLLHFTHEK